MRRWGPALAVHGPRLASAAVVAAVIGVVFPYATLRLGFGPNVSIVSTLLGYLVLAATRTRGRDALHATHAAGVAAGQTAFMGVALVAFEILRARHAAQFGPRPSFGAVFVWLASAGVIGVLAAIPLRKHYIEDEKLTFAAGAAAAETILALEARGSERRAPSLALSLVGSAAFTWIRPAGLAISALGVGSGMLLGLRVAASMALGWLGARLLRAELGPWVASSLMVVGGLAAAVLRMPGLARGLWTRGRGTATSGAWLVAVGGACAVASLCMVNRYALDFPVVLTLASVALAAPLLLVGTRVLGETNWAPVLSLATVAQAALGALSPGCVAVTMVGSAVAGAIPNGGQHMMQSFRAAAIVGARPRDTVVAQILGVVVGALALTATYPLLAGGLAPGGISSPLSEAWATFAEAFARGSDGLPLGARAALSLAAALGFALVLLERRLGAWAPSATAIGIGMLVPGGLVAGVLAGSVLAKLAAKHAPTASATHGTAVASGLVAGEALAVCGAALLRLG